MEGPARPKAESGDGALEALAGLHRKSFRINVASARTRPEEAPRLLVGDIRDRMPLATLTVSD
jgi:hypothetical protein